VEKVMTLTDMDFPEQPRPADEDEEEDPEEFAEELGTDPTALEVDEYREMIGDPPPEPTE
jgi:hypothetical protein